MSNYILKEATTQTEPNQIVDLAWKAWHEPYLPSFQLFHPVFGATEADVAAGFQADKERAWSSHSNNPASHWIVVVDPATDEFMGAVQWLIFTGRHSGSRGIGTSLMQWGIDQADKLGLEVFIEASEAGKPLYYKFGMINLMKIEICPEKKNPVINGRSSCTSCFP
ncbi:hypothetical protein HYALB_00006945 [Hymenoscyphus albidus]|uniref:N-acetyltransferase domain-containing protein n=1 Tax=Hymenoscyphus albidus TaxID=595503 RepID=A0A9N9LFH6_9HELO|nr:hypothetical protein HYALB_00006945 [Hymenoscyphus albidus]